MARPSPESEQPLSSTSSNSEKSILMANLRHIGIVKRTEAGGYHRSAECKVTVSRFCAECDCLNCISLLSEIYSVILLTQFSGIHKGFTDAAKP